MISSAETEMRHAGSQDTAAREAARAVVRAIAQPAFVLHPDGRLLAHNPAAARLLGVDPGPTLFEALAVVPDHVRERLRHTPRSSLPKLVRLHFNNELPQLFQATMLHPATAKRPAQLLLVLNKVGEIVGKYAGLKAYHHRLARGRRREGRRADAFREEAVRFKHLSETDALTGLLNLRAFRAHVTRALQDRPSRSAALVFMDINDFKGVNDRHGHAIGDAALRAVAKRLTFPPQTWIKAGRMGGDEFAVWLPGVRENTLHDVMTGLRARVNVELDPEPDTGMGPIRITASLGGACCPSEAQDFDTLKRLADMRMYRDKTAQR